jgi:hypothetical protein
MTTDEIISRCYEHGQPDYVLAAERLKALQAEMREPYPKSDIDKLGRRVDPASMPEALKDTIAICYGLLWQVNTDNSSVHRARRGLLQWLTKDEQRRGIEIARVVIGSNGDRQNNIIPRSWAVTINVNGDQILTIGHNHLSGIENIDDYTNAIENCAEHLLAFIGQR